MPGASPSSGSYLMTPGFCSEVLHIFHADRLTKGPSEQDEDERIEVESFTSEEAWRLLATGNADAKTVLALFWLQGGQGEIGRDRGR